MRDHDVFWKLEALSDRQLMERVGSMLGSSRQLMAELIAHLGEVEERRLHLAVACSSMFAYCLKLGMTEDEAYRRIEVARLARRYPAIFPLLANGQLSMSVVALLKHHLSEENHLDLLAAVTGKSVGQTRELIAARFPRPDVPSSVRKLPERHEALQAELAMSSATDHVQVHASPTPTAVAKTGEPMSSAPAVEATCTLRPESPSPPTFSQPAAPRRPSSRIDPLSAHRYKVQLTASAELARKLVLARDLLRHSHPSGELGPIVEQAMDLLIESLMKRRFGKIEKASPKRAIERVSHTGPEQRGDIMDDRSAMDGTAAPDTAALADTPVPDTTSPAGTARLDSADPRVDRGAEPEQASTASSHIPRSTRRIVVERDGLSCSWVDEHGARCGSRAWLEYDHCHPRAKGGAAQPDNVRILCRSHNRFAAEQEYGRRHIERSIAERRRHRATAPATRDMTGG